MLMSAAGAVVMVSANDLIVLFIGPEVVSIAAYVLAAMHTRRLSSQEAGIKYFVLGSFGSAILLYGIALVYGDRFDEPVARAGVPESRSWSPTTGCCWRASRCCWSGSGSARCGAVPHVGARRVSGCTVARDGVHVVCGQGRGVRWDAQGVRGGVRELPRAVWGRSCSCSPCCRCWSAR